MPINPNLIKALALAAKGNIEAHIQVYTELLDSELLVPIEKPLSSSSDDVGVITIPTPSGEHGVPAFTHTQAVWAWRSGWGHVMSIASKEVFRMALDSGSEALVLNPAGPEGMAVMRREELAALVCGIVPKLPSEERVRRSDAYFKQGADLVQPYLFLTDGQSKNRNTPQGHRDFQQGAEYLKSSIKEWFGYWPAHWFLGKILEAQGEYKKAYWHFRAAYDIKPDQIDVCRELVLASLRVDEFDEAERIARRVVNLSPTDAGLIANLGLTLLLKGQLTDAKTAVEQALVLDTNDRVTQNLLKIISQIQSGRRSQPCKLSELETAVT